IRLFREHEQSERVSASGSAPRFSVPLARAGDGACGESPELLAQNTDVTIGLLGTVLVAVWPGPPSLEALELLDRQMHGASERLGSGLAYLAIVEGSTSTPTLEARKKITHMLRQHSKHYGVYPHVLLGGFSWIARPIMAGLALLAGIPAPMPFFGSVERASSWLVSGYLRESLLDVQVLVGGTNALRATAARHSEAQRAGSARAKAAARST
ncbi:MAG TPA: hypothetical protein VNW92_25775, partial [Polyangiaceae bacterium]|nr:hypothetical protein [Polyangiaceae bacterium]